MKYRFHKAAASEHLESVAFYESRLAGLGADYLAEFEAAMVRVCAAPASCPIDCPPDIRIARLKRFPFNILFRQRDESLQVLAVAHQRRRPGYWVPRIEGINSTE